MEGLLIRTLTRTLGPLVNLRGLNPAGALFGKEMRVSARRKRTYIMRVVYLGVLLLVLLMTYAENAGRTWGGVAQRVQRQAEMGMNFFISFSIFTLVAMALIAPVLTSTAIGSERLARTLPVLLMTPINSWQIIAGKLLSRMLAALTLIGLSLPVLALVRLLGGVELEQMVASVCVCTSFAMFAAAIGLFYSTLMTRAFAVILLAYLTIAFLYLFVPFVLAMSASRGGPDRGLMQFMAATNPGVAMMLVIEPRMAMLRISWEPCVIVHVLATAGLVAWSAAILRRQARTAGDRPAAATPEWPQNWPQPVPVIRPGPSMPGPPPVIDPSAGGAAAPPPLPPQMATAAPAPPPVDYATPAALRPRATVRRRADVGENPVLWREIRRPLFPRLWQRITAISIASALLLITYAVLGEENDFDDPDSQIGFGIVFAGVAWLLTAVLSATAISAEKESDTWTLLLASPVSGAQIVWGKVAGLYRRLLWPTVFMVGHFLLFMMLGILHPAAFFLVLWVVLTFNTIWIATGVWLSLKMSKVTFAVIANLLLAVGLYAIVAIVLGVVGQLVDHRGEAWSEQVLWYLPYYYIGEGMDELSRGWGSEQRYYPGPYGGRGTYAYHRSFDLPGRRHDGTGEEFATAVIVAGLLYMAVSALILVRTAQNFDRIVGRAGRHAHVGKFDSDEAVVPVGDLPITGPAPGPAPPVAAASGFGYAGFWRRLGALLIDELIVRVSCGLIGLGAGLIVVASSVAPVEDYEYNYVTGRSRSEQVMLDYVVYAVLGASLVGWLYYALFESSRRRATPGKALMGLFVTDLEGRRIGFWQASGRYFCKLLSAIPLGIGFVMAGLTPRKQAMHDTMAGTLVLRS